MIHVKRPLSDYKVLAEAIQNEDEELLRTELSNRLNRTCSDDLKSEVYDYVIVDQNYWNVRELLAGNPRTVYYMSESLACSTEEIEDFVTVAAYAYKNDTMLLDAKYHMFIKACDSAFITLGKSTKADVDQTEIDP